MTTPVIDVNEAFKAEKIQQLDNQRQSRLDAIKSAENRAAKIDADVASGKLTPVGNDQFRINDGADRGEYITVRRNTKLEVVEVVAQHGVDLFEDGRVKVFSSTPTWHGFGQIIPGGTSNIQTALELSGLNFPVEKRPVLFRGQTDASRSILHELPDHFVTVRADTEAGLGTVGRNYTVIQNAEAFEFLQQLVDDGDVVIESALSLRGGASVALCVRLPEDITIEAEGVSDIVRPFLAAFNSHDGNGSFKAVATPWRPVCRNTERFALRDAHTSWSVSHTRNALERIKEARRTLQMAHKYYKSWTEESTLLAQTPMSAGQFDAFISEVWTPLEAEESDSHLKHRHVEADQARRDALHWLFGESETLETCRGTAYAARSALTEYLDQLVPLRASKSELTGLGRRQMRALEGDRDDVKKRVHRQLLTLTNR